MRLSFARLCRACLGVAELKSRLSEYLRAVRGGETISVLDRETPVAQIVPIREKNAGALESPPQAHRPPIASNFPSRSR
jgi:prevent-host-death family protein